MKSYTILLTLFLLLVSKSDFAQELFVSDIDGNRYPVVILGDLYWMASNLKTTRLNDGTPIQQVKITTTDFTTLEFNYYSKLNTGLSMTHKQWSESNKPTFMFYNNSEANALTYGFLYSYNAASSSKICPSGWRLISTEDWEKLIKIYPFDLDKTQPNIADLNAKKGWGIITYNTYNPNDGMDVPVNLSLNGKNTTSFTALPGGGYLGEYFNFNDKGNNAFFWSKNKSTNELEQIVYLGRWAISGGEMEHTRDKLDTDKESAYSIRCVCETMPPKNETLFKESKKDQIVALQDALNKENTKAWFDEIKELEDRAHLNILNYNLLNFVYDSLSNTRYNLDEIQTKVSDLELSNKQLSNSNQQLNQNTQNLTTELEQIKQQNLVLKQEVEQLKTNAQTPAKQPTTNAQAGNSTSNSSSSNTVVQTGSYKSVKIGMQTWMTENLNVSTFRNGDPIPEAKTKEEWDEACRNHKPMWCYLNQDSKNSSNYGKYYNLFAVRDPRGLAPVGWRIPSEDEYCEMVVYLSPKTNCSYDLSADKLKSKTGWNEYGCRRCDGGSETFKANCSSCKGKQKNSSDPMSGNGNNSSGFNALPGGWTTGSEDFWIKNKLNFFPTGNDAHFWTSTTFLSDVYVDEIANNSFRIFNDRESIVSYLYEGANTESNYILCGGLNVRCVKD